MEFKNTRLAQYLLYTTIYFLFWKLVEFEFAAIVALGQIMGEIHFLNNVKHKKQ